MIKASRNTEVKQEVMQGWEWKADVNKLKNSGWNWIEGKKVSKDKDKDKTKTKPTTTPKSKPRSKKKPTSKNKPISKKKPTYKNKSKLKLQLNKRQGRSAAAGRTGSIRLKGVPRSALLELVSILHKTTDTGKVEKKAKESKGERQRRVNRESATRRRSRNRREVDQADEPTIFKVAHSVVMEVPIEDVVMEALQKAFIGQVCNPNVGESTLEWSRRSHRECGTEKRRNQIEDQRQAEIYGER